MRAQALAPGENPATRNANLQRMVAGFELIKTNSGQALLGSIQRQEASAREAAVQTDPKKIKETAATLATHIHDVNDKYNKWRQDVSDHAYATNPAGVKAIDKIASAFQTGGIAIDDLAGTSVAKAEGVAATVGRTVANNLRNKYQKGAANFIIDMALIVAGGNAPNATDIANSSAANFGPGKLYSFTTTGNTQQDTRNAINQLAQATADALDKVRIQQGKGAVQPRAGLLEQIMTSLEGIRPAIEENINNNVKATQDLLKGQIKVGASPAEEFLRTGGVKPATFETAIRTGLKGK